MAYNDYTKQRIIHSKGDYAPTIIMWVSDESSLVTSCAYGHGQGAWVGAWEVEGRRNAQTRVGENNQSVIRAYNEAVINVIRKYTGLFTC